MGELIKFPERGKKNGVEEGLERLQGLFEMISATQHFHDKIDALAEFEKVEKELIAQGHFASEAEVVHALERRGATNIADVLALMRATIEE
ncbi:MAG: hypothetical protein A3B31_01930 [Candidatus Komeilibacteria bacterium RIFCSPLOWO2_01_FULL_53_11]|uniref:Uncharacterized protein n=1 Tax=Candidatus Komeilibacteria bacterium RIFCSPLOWO2_01_FULL_53_11 TaxID=1798552 RepID=A0A1G2BXG2_9BACT|nr:MAG: hypothetical protein A3B31_01930 [Candidatus Komeilibacteria bacterium RIFCSPLOWO2_01_FULL_53_11]